MHSALANPFEFAGVASSADMAVASPIPSRSDDAAVDNFPRGFDVGAFMAAIEPSAGYA
jgi:hypothetical protein